MRICINTSSFPGYDGDCAGAFVLELASALQAMGHEVWALCPAVGEGRGADEINGVRVFRYRYAFPAKCQFVGGDKPAVPKIKGNPFLLFVIPFYAVAQFFSLIWLIKRHKIEVVNSHWLVPQGLIAAFVCALTGARHVMTLHSTDVYLAAKLPFSRRLCNMAERGAHSVFIVSAFVRKRYEAILGRASGCNVIPMGVNGEKFHADGDVRRDYNKILFIGRLHRIKGIDNLIRAVAIIAKERQDIKLEIAGGGEEKESLEKLVDDLNLKEHVSFTGFIPNNMLAPYYNSAVSVAVPSLLLPSGETEGMPVVILEAMACGIPVIASDVGGISDVLKDGCNGFLFKPGSPEEIAGAIRKIFDADIDELSENALKTGALYHWGKVAARYEEEMKA